MDFLERYKENRVRQAIKAYEQKQKNRGPAGGDAGVLKVKGGRPVQDADDI